MQFGVFQQNRTESGRSAVTQQTDDSVLAVRRQVATGTESETVTKTKPADDESGAVRRGVAVSEGMTIWSATLLKPVIPWLRAWDRAPGFPGCEWPERFS